MVKKIITWICVIGMSAIFLLDTWVLILCSKYEKEYVFTEETFDGTVGDDRIHFLNTGCSDCILLESNGHFALIDTGEGDNNPRKNLTYAGNEEKVLSYLHDVCEDDTQTVHLDFLLLTHNHYDHNGCAEAILSDKSIQIDMLYMKHMTPGVDHEYETTRWKLPETYEKIETAAAKREIPVIYDIPTTMQFGDFSATLYNTVTPAEEMQDKGDNAESIGIRLEKSGYIVFLAADITASTGLEQLLGEQIGKVNLLKIGHHGYYGSSSMRFLRQLQPDVAIVTNALGKIYPNVKWNLTMTAHVPIYATVNRNGIIATVTDDGNVTLTENIHKQNAG